MNSNKSIILINNLSWSDHRSGWNYVLSLLEDYKDDKGIMVDGCIDSTFGYREYENNELEILPYTRPWVGFMHHPVEICPWYDQDNLSPNYVLNSEKFKESLPSCLGIFTLSEHLAKYIQKQVKDIPLKVLKHPTEFNAKLFNYENFVRSKKLVQIGCWMREFIPFFNLKVDGYEKYLPLNTITLNYLKQEILWNKSFSAHTIETVSILKHLSNELYDDLLSESIVFLKLFDSSANNAIIECIARNTPIIVNKIPAVVEYLGNDYPLYYTDVKDVNNILNDSKRIIHAHQYLVSEINKNQFSGEYFLNQFFEAVREFESIK